MTKPVDRVSSFRQCAFTRGWSKERHRVPQKCDYHVEVIWQEQQAEGKQCVPQQTRILGLRHQHAGKRRQEHQPPVRGQKDVPHVYKVEQSPNPVREAANGSQEIRLQRDLSCMDALVHYWPLPAASVDMPGLSTVPFEATWRCVPGGDCGRQHGWTMDRTGVRPFPRSLPSRWPDSHTVASPVQVECGRDVTSRACRALPFSRFMPRVPEPFFRGEAARPPSSRMP